jgi:hypothetical protein
MAGTDRSKPSDDQYGSGCYPPDSEASKALARNWCGYQATERTKNGWEGYVTGRKTTPGPDLGFQPGLGDGEIRHDFGSEYDNEGL